MTAELPNLSLYQLDDRLVELIQYREERLYDLQSPADEEELRTLDVEITKYLEALPKKVTGVVSVFRLWDDRESNIDAQIMRLTAAKLRISKNRERLKSYVAEILDRQPEPVKGCKKLEGVDGSVLMLKKNGGLAPLKIQDDVLPDEYRTTEIRLPATYVADVVAQFPGAKAGRTEPDNGRIREALKTGEVPGAWLTERGQHVEIR